jgi:hypothetical protein
MKNAPFLLALILMASTACAQNTVLTGYIVRSSGDTLHGSFREGSASDLLHSVAFRQSADNDFKVYTPDEVRAFGFDNGYLYRSVSYSDISRDHPIIKTCFAKLLVSGEYDLYSFTDDQGLFFLGRKDTTLYLLFDDDLRTVPFVNGNFRNELNFFAVGCESLRSGIESINYSEQSITSFFRKLDECANPGKAVATYYQKAKAHVGFYAYAGGFAIASDQNQFTGEARLRLVYPSLDRGVSLNVGVHYTYLNKKVVDQYYTVAKIYHAETYSIFSIPVTIQYNLTRGIVQPFVFAGFSACRNNITTFEQYVQSTDPYYRHFGLAFLAGCGVEVSLTHFLEARAEWRYEDILQWPTLGLSVTF